nr:MAG TPA: Prodomain subtilisin 2 [Caudoviricetes sp.]
MSIFLCFFLNIIFKNFIYKILKIAFLIIKN